MPRLIRKFLPFVLMALTASPLADAPKKLLVVTTTKGFRHSSIATAEKVLADVGERSGAFTVADYARVDPNDPQFKRPDGKRDNAKVNAAIDQVIAEKLSLSGLKKYDGVVFANTTGMLPIPDRELFLAWIKSGKAFIGMHSATDTLKGWPEFVDFIGGHFAGHGAQLTVDIENMDPKHPATRHFRKFFEIRDEIYLLGKFDRSKVHGLLTLDQNPHTGSKQFNHPGDYPISWCKDYGQGKMFYTSLGHREDVWENPAYQRHILGGIEWALGLAAGDGAPQSPEYAVSEREAEKGFKPLFNGKNLNGWKLRKPDGNPSWSAQNGMLVNEIKDGAHGADLITEDKFWNFTIRAEYMVPKGSNSGLYLRGRHEIQILEDFDSLKPRDGGNGGIYSVKAPDYFVSKPANEWQQLTATIRDDRISATLNGVKIHDRVVVDRATGGELDRDLDQPGAIMLQGDHGAVAFRNIRIKELN